MTEHIFIFDAEIRHGVATEDNPKQPGFRYAENENGRAKNLPPPVEQSTIETREAIVNYLRANGRTQAIKVQRHFGYTKSKFYHALDGLIESGQVISHRVHFHCTILEAP